MAAGSRRLTIEALVARYGLAALFVGAGVEGETVTVAGGLLAHEGLWPLWAACAATAAGSFVADQLFFAAGRRCRDHPRVQRMTQRPAFTKALTTLERHPTGFVFAFRFLYGLRTISPIAIGTTRIAAGRFVVLNAAAAFVWAVVFSTLGYLFGHGVAQALGRLKPSRETAMIAIGVAIVLATAIAAIRWWKGRQA